MKIVSPEYFVLNRIEELCKKHNYSHYKLAKKSGVHQSSLSTLLNRKSIPSINTLAKICKGFDITLAQFFSLEEDKYSDLTDDQQSVLRLLDDMNYTERKMVIAYMQGLTDSRTKR